MMNHSLIQEAVKLVNNYYAAENIYESDEVLFARASIWYGHTEITDAETLAAVVMYGEFDTNIRIADIREIKEHFFPTEPVDFTNFHIGEIEEAQLDSLFLI